MVGAGGLGHLRQSLDEGGEHLAHVFLCLQRPALGFGLLENDVFQASFHIVKTTQGERWRCGCQQGLNLALEPAVVQTELAYVLDDQV